MFKRKPPDSLSDAERELHPSWRRYTAKYRQKKRLVRDIWIVSGVIMLFFNGAIGAIMLLALVTAFLSFAILDETN